MTLDQCFFLLGSIVLIGPAALVAILGLTSLFSRPLNEAAIARTTLSVNAIGLLASISILVLMLTTRTHFVPLELGNWVAIPAEHFHFHLKFVFDRLSVPFLILTFVLTGTIGGFAKSYLHREPGYRRYFILYAVFLLGMVVSTVAGTIETLFVGWELVGVSSALLVAYFQERAAPVRNGLHVWTVYRVADSAFLIAAILLHQMSGAGEFSKLVGAGLWPEGEASLTSSQAFSVGMLLLIAAAGKSAMIPFSGWLPRAMEGPTPSSAIFYGALSVHLGAYLLLRVSPILECSQLLCGIIVTVGVLTAVFAALAARVQTDVKSALAFASMTQVGIIVAEIGLGFRYLPLIHIIGHACLRTLQLLRAPMLLTDYRAMENALGTQLPQKSSPAVNLFPKPMRRWLYRIAFDRGGLDRFLIEWIVRPFQNVFIWFDRMERRWTDLLAGQSSRGKQQTRARPESLEELP